MITSEGNDHHLENRAGDSQLTGVPTTNFRLTSYEEMFVCFGV